MEGQKKGSVGLKKLNFFKDPISRKLKMNPGT